MKLKETEKKTTRERKKRRGNGSCSF